MHSIIVVPWIVPAVPGAHTKTGPTQGVAEWPVDAIPEGRGV